MRKKNKKKNYCFLHSNKTVMPNTSIQCSSNSATISIENLYEIHVQICQTDRLITIP